MVYYFYFLSIFDFIGMLLVGGRDFRRLMVPVGANRSHGYYSHGKELGLWPNTQSENKSVSEDDQQRKK